MDLRKDIFFYADLASFPASGAENKLYVDKSLGFIYTWDGSSYVVSSESGLNYLGLWNANTNSPNIQSSVGNTSDYYIVGTAGTTNINGISDWGVGDWIIFSSTGVWQKIDNSETPSINIYNSNGTLTGNRTVDLNSNTLTFSNGIVNFNQGTTNSGEIRLYEDADFGGNYIALRAPQSFGSDISLFLPASLGTNGQVLTTNGLGVTSWTTVGATGLFGIADSTGTYTYYTTLTLAMAAATSGQTIEFFTDYTETGNVTIQLKNGVHINGNGHTYTHSYAAGNSNTFVNTSGVISCVISNLRVIRTGRANGTTGDLVIYTNQYSEILFENVYVESTYGNAVVFESGVTSTYKAMQGSLYAKAYLGAIISYQHIEGLKGESTTNGIGVSVSSGLGGSPKATNCIGISVSGKGMMVSSNASGGGGGYNCVGQSISGQGMTNGPYYNCTAISVSGPAGETIQGAYNCSFISSSGFGCDGISGSNNTLISASGAGVYGFFGFSLYNSYVYSSGNVGASTRGSILSNCVVITDWNNAGGHSVSEWYNSSIGKTLNCHLKVANASANCIASPSGALNMKYASNVFEGATTPVNANITQAITNTEDNQGNILI